MNSFECFSISPISMSHPGIAVATTRAGGVGILDGEFCHDRDRSIANIEKLLELVNQTEAVGLRLRGDQINDDYQILERLGDRVHYLIISEVREIGDIKALVREGRKILIEITDAVEASVIREDIIDGIIAKGHESGGWVGEDSAYILLQKLREKTSLPIYVQGGIGIHTAAACRGAGASGIVLDDQLWLMPESPMPESWQKHLANLNGQEAITIGERLNASCRVLSRPGFEAIENLQELAERLGLENPQDWREKASRLVGWDSPGMLAWPVGQAIGLAAGYRDRYKTTGRCVQALLNGSREQIEIAQKLQPLGENAPLAVTHGTKYPIVQGPMTRVSDKAEFADAVSQAGGLPLLALALMGGPQVRSLLTEAQEKMGDRPWGVGILGFVPQELREEQLKIIAEIRPPFALIAGGRPDQAAQLESLGIATYIHVPVPKLLEMFLEQGARKFVFEGRECGGHVGPLSSFMLWESTISTLLASVPEGVASDEQSQINVLFAGGIHDARSAAMVSAMAAPLAERGMKIGVLMGSAYLFTEEAVSSGAIVKGFQAQALTCTRTINLETGPGHASRCAVTPFAGEFYQTRRQMMAEGRGKDEISRVLEDLTLGRLRIASKGLTRDAAGEMVTVDSEKQIAEGMYMIGQVATMRDRVLTVQQLHEEVSQGSKDLLAKVRSEDFSPQKVRSEDFSPPSDIAIIGISTLLPKAQDPETFWQNIIEKVNAITEIPANRWDWRIYYDPDRNARDKVYSKWGGFIDDVPFDPISFGIPPKSMKSIEPLQLLTLEAVRRALVDAGLFEGSPLTPLNKGGTGSPLTPLNKGGTELDFSRSVREKTSVILGAGGGMGDLGQQYTTRATMPLFVEKTSSQVWERLPEWTEESFPGTLLNVIAGRVANKLDLGGSNFTVDAACAGSLAAIDLAVQELESGRSNMVIAGGVDGMQTPWSYFCFSKTQALSPQGVARSFDKNADGIVISEGIAIVVLKRLADAQRDGDRIYAVIKAVAGSSDGKGLSMTAPRPAGQRRALQRAYNKAGFSPNTLGLYEAHGTGTVAGDRAELETITETLRNTDAGQKSCAIGSVKTTIGHTKSTAGVAALVKMALSLYHKVLPPHTNVEQPIDAIASPESPVYLLKEAHPWLGSRPRRGGVSAFGFGGTNFHATLEEYNDWQSPVLGAENWPWELIILQGENREALIKEVRFLLETLLAGAEPRLADLAYTYASGKASAKALTTNLTICVKDLVELTASLELALKHLEGNSGEPLPLNIQLQEVTGTQERQDKIAFLFPGQGAQYPEMAREVALYFPQMRQALELADRETAGKLPKLLSQFIYPASAYSETEKLSNKQQLTDTHVAQPAIGTISMGFLEIIAQLGLKADMVGGHSYGEYTALYAAGVLPAKEFLRLSETRGRVMASACEVADGAMAAVQMSARDLLEYLSSFPQVVLANHNAPLQSVISGERTQVEEVVSSLTSKGIQARMLPVAGAFHSSLVESATGPLSEAIADCQLESPQIPVYSNGDGIYSSEPEAISKRLSAHALNSVQFVNQIEAMYAAGARVFVEVGPKSILKSLVGQILADKDHTVVSLDGQGGGLKGLLLAVGKLVTSNRVNIDPTGLFAGRQVKQLDLSKLVELTGKPKLSPTTWLLNGGTARPVGVDVGYMGKRPPLTLETKSSHERAELPIERERQSQVERAAQSAKALPKSRIMSRSQQHKQVNTQSRMSRSNQQPTSSNYQVSPDAAVIAYQAYQETMRQFLKVQESVMQQFLSGGIPPNPPDRGLDAAAAPMLAEPQSQIPPNPPYRRGEPEAQSRVPQIVRQTPVQQIVTPPNGLQETGNGTKHQVGWVEEGNPGQVGWVSERNPTAMPDRESLTEMLLKIVSDRTGYPQEMLGLDQDLEAELGIDSIKRVEILGALGKNLPIALSKSMQAEMETLTRVKTLNGLIARVLENGKSPSPPIGDRQSAMPDKESLRAMLLKIVSDRTGYPPEMLGLDLDLEAELGIDSIKRVEILGALGKNLPEASAGNIQAQMETLTRVKTLNGLIAHLLEKGENSQSEITKGEENGLGKYQSQSKALGVT
ncbi:MAG: beta-ketoacyl synthase N-terminal-like domain-containing protein [Hormoscilla sp.]